MQKLMKLSLSLFTLLLLGQFSPAADRPRPTADRIYQLLFLSHEFLLERNNNQVEHILNDALLLAPENPVLLLNMAQLLFTRGREEEAKQTMDKAYLCLPKGTPVEQLLFALWAGKGSDVKTPPPTEAQILAIEKQFPDDFLTFLTSGYFYEREFKFATAIQKFEKTIILAPWLGQAHNNLGYLYTYVRDYSRAIDHLEQYAVLMPARANPHDSLGEIYHLTGRYNDAIQEFQSALAISPSFTAATGHLIQAHIAIGQLSAALRLSLQLWESEESDDQKAYGLRLISEVYRLKGDLKRAQDKARAAIALRPERLSSLHQLGLVQAEAGDWNGLQDTLQRMDAIIRSVTKKGSKSEENLYRIDYNYLLAKMNVALGDYDSAVEIYQKIIQAIPIPHNRIQAKTDLAEIYFAMGQTSKSLELLDRVLEINPNHVRALILWAKILIDSGRYGEARIALMRSLEILKNGDKDSPMYQSVVKLSQQLTMAGLM